MLKLSNTSRFSLRKGKKLTIDRMKTVTSERCNTNILYRSVKGIFSITINNIY